MGRRGGRGRRGVGRRERRGGRGRRGRRGRTYGRGGVFTGNIATHARRSSCIRVSVCR